MFLLAINICTQPHECRWKRMGSFLSEARCHYFGGRLLLDEQVYGYKCVMQMRGD